MITNLKGIILPLTSISVSFILGLMLTCLPKIALAETVTIFIDQSAPQIAFAAGDIKTALEAKSFTVVVQDLSTLTGTHAGMKVVIALALNQPVSALLATQGGKAVAALGEQAYALRTTTTPQMSYWVLGGDHNGAMYGGLQIAENINFSGFTASYNEEESPYIKSRGIKFNIPLDKESPTYFYNNHGTSHQVAIRHVWDMSFWTTWFDEMARNRYNVLSLWSPHPFTSMIKMADYPDVAIQGVQGYDENDEKIKINDMTIEEKIVFWQKVMKYGRDRGFGLYFCTWNIFLSTAEDKYGLTDKPDNELTKAYLKKCTKEFLATYPDLTGFGVTVGENMGGIDDKQKEEWAWAAYGQGMMEYAQANPKRELVFIHRFHQGKMSEIADTFLPLRQQPNVRMDMSFKYSEAHAHAAVKPGYWDKRKISEGLDQYKMKSWLTVRNDDFYFLQWADTQFVRDYVNGFPGVGKYVDAFYIGADGWVFTGEFASKDPYYKNKNALSIQKTWYMQKLWGRISFNPAVSDTLFKNHLAYKYPEAASEQLFQAWNNASRALQIANEQVTGTWSLDFHWWPEGWTSSKTGFLTLNDTRKVEPMRGSQLSSFKDTAAGKLDGKVSAFITADKIEALATDALKTIAAMDAGKNKELQLNLKDLEAMGYLGLYDANKFRAAIYLEQNKPSEAKDAIGKAYGFWIKYTNIMDSLYRGTDLQRNASFPNWHANDANALKDLTDLGGK